MSTCIVAGQPYPSDVNTVHLTEAELEMARHALRAYLGVFGHDETDTTAKIKSVIAKLDAARHSDEADKIAEPSGA